MIHNRGWGQKEPSGRVSEIIIIFFPVALLYSGNNVIFYNTQDNDKERKVKTKMTAKENKVYHMRET